MKKSFVYILMPLVFLCGCTKSTDNSSHTKTSSTLTEKTVIDVKNPEIKNLQDTSDILEYSDYAFNDKKNCFMELIEYDESKLILRSADGAFTQIFDYSFDGSIFTYNCTVENNTEYDVYLDDSWFCYVGINNQNVPFAADDLIFDGKPLNAFGTYTTDKTSIDIDEHKNLVNIAGNDYNIWDNSGENEVYLMFACRFEVILSDEKTTDDLSVYSNSSDKGIPDIQIKYTLDKDGNLL